jgi:LCP family protein required for cell wall assembly
MRSSTSTAKRHWAVRLFRGLTIGVGVICLAFASLVTLWLHGVRIPIASGKAVIKIQKLSSANFEGEPSGTQFILLIGSDLRPGVGGSRADAIHVLAVNPKLHRGTIINIPRDTCAAIPGYGTTKINAANAYGGPPLTAQVVGAMLGVHLTYSVLVDFAGFIALVNGAGGVTVNIPFTMNDHDSGAHIAVPGVYHLDGGAAIAFSRDRHDFPRGDVTRTQNQATLVLAAIGQLRARANTPAGAFRLLSLLGTNAAIHGASLNDLYRLGRLAQSTDVHYIRNMTIPVGGGSCLPLLGSAPGLFADFADDGVLETH